MPTSEGRFVRFQMTAQNLVTARWLLKLLPLFLGKFFLLLVGQLAISDHLEFVARIVVTPVHAAAPFLSCNLHEKSR